MLFSLKLRFKAAWNCLKGQPTIAFLNLRHPLNIDHQGTNRSLMILGNKITCK